MLALALADGLGHGPAARLAADAALGVFHEHPEAPPLDLLGRCDQALARTRGAAVALCRLELGAAELVHAGAGNVSVHLYQDGPGERFTSAARVVGRAPAGRPRDERATLGARHLVLMYSDGLSSRIDLSLELELRRQPPPVIAHELLRRASGAPDDCTVLVARYG